MSAINTVLEVIQWAQTADGANPPPSGDLRSADRLIDPPKTLTLALSQLTAVTAGRMRLGSPPLGDNGLVGTGTLMIAAAIGLRRMPEQAAALLDTVPEPYSTNDWIARYGLIKPALGFLTEILADQCRLRSPLTALLHRPAPGAADQAMVAAHRLLENRYGRLFLVQHMAKPTANAAIRKWRHNLLNRLNHGTSNEQDFVLDVYEAMMIHYRHPALEQIKDAHAIFNDPETCTCEEKLQEALSIASFWEPLMHIERDNLDRLRERLYLDYAYVEGIKLFILSLQLRGGSV